MSSAAERIRAEIDAEREEVAKCEREIQTIKSALRQLGGAAAAGEEETPNTLEVSVLKVEGLPESAQPTFSLQLSSPVEEASITKLFDPLGPSDEGSVAVFTSVETSVATLTLTAKDADITLGASEPHDVAPLCPLDAMTPAPQYVSEVPVAIVSESKREGAETPFEDAKEEIKETEEEEGAKEETKEEDKVTVPVCVATLRVTYKPSAKDQREELYDLLNKASQKKTQAIDRLRKTAAAASRVPGASSTEMTARSAGPAVRPGFLNKSAAKKQQKEPSKLMAWYNRTLGPESLLRKVFPIAKNYVIFFGAVALFHFKGQELALPPPV